MTKLLYNEEKINSQIKSNIGSCITSLQNAINSSSFSIPSDFSYRSYLQGISSELLSNKTKIENCETWLNNATNSVDTTFESLEKSANNLDDFEIVERKNSVTIL